MTRYAIDHDRNALVAVWGTGAGDVATTVTAIPASATAEVALRLAQAMGHLSEILWRRYAEPNEAEDDPEPNSEDWRRQGDRRAFSAVTDAIMNPNLPMSGGLLVSYIPVEEAAHSVGRAVHAVNDDGLKAQVIAEAQLELRAIHSAEIGDYTGRARQAVLVSRPVATPEQVSKADAMLHDEPLGCRGLVTDVDPTAAALAAAHWLQAAADVVGEIEDIDPTRVVIEADNIEEMPIESTSAVLDRLASGETPREVVLDLVGAAMRVATGEIPDPDALVAEIQAARRRLRRLRALSRGEDVQLEPLRASVLDPRRPSRDLLEDLLEGIRGCLLLYQSRGEDSDDDLGGEDIDDEFDDAAADAREDRMTAAFYEEVRAEAATQRDRLSLGSE